VREWGAGSEEWDLYEERKIKNEWAEIKMRVEMNMG